MVRCGGCGAVFNAYDTLMPEFEAPPAEKSASAETGAWDIEGGYYDSSEPSGPSTTEVEVESSPAAEPDASGFASPASAEHPWDSSAPWQDEEAIGHAEADLEAGPQSPVEVPGYADAIAPAADESGVWPDQVTSWSEEVVQISGESGRRDVSAPPAAETSDEILLSELPTRRKSAAGRPIWKPFAYGTLSFVLGLLFLGQLAYFLRGEIVSQQPGWRPWLEQACGVIGCRIPLAQDLKLLRIESSSLETDPEQPAHARLHISLVNRSNAEQAWPYLILKLTDAKNAPLAQKAFTPAEYLPKGAAPEAGVRPMSEQECTVDLDLAAVEAAGYEVKLHYP
jgi:hypothetical protein